MPLRIVTSVMFGRSRTIDLAANIFGEQEIRYPCSNDPTAVSASAFQTAIL